MIAIRADLEVMHKLKVMNNLTALGAFLPKSLRHFPFLICWEL
jgi:hypothetical protein